MVLVSQRLVAELSQIKEGRARAPVECTGVGCGVSRCRVSREREEMRLGVLMSSGPDQGHDSDIAESEGGGQGKHD
jgi:hypothetical protein